MRIVTYITDISRKSFTEECVNLWQCEKWQGFTQRVHRVMDWLRTVNNEEIICFVDGYDVQIFGTPKQIEERYLSMKVDGVLFMSEATCYPYPEYTDRFPSAPFRYRYINAGSYIGRAGDILTLFDAMRFERIPAKFNDQAILTDYYLANPQSFTLDTKCELFQNLCDSHQDIERIKGVYTNTLTNTRPLIFHASGGAGLLKE